MDGIEPEPTFYNECKKVTKTVINGLFPQDFTLDKKYDFIIFNDVFEHIENLDTTLEKCKALLKDGGLLIINAPNSNGIFFFLAKLLNKLKFNSAWKRLWQFDFFSPHIWYFNPQNLSILLKKYGFSNTAECKLRSVTASSLKKRVLYKEKNSISSYLTYSEILILFPIIKMLPNDIMCLFYTKQ